MMCEIVRFLEGCVPQSRLTKAQLLEEVARLRARLAQLDPASQGVAAPGQQPERMYQTIFQTTGTAVVVLEGDTTVSLANAEFMTLTGATPELLASRPSWTIFMDEDDVPRMLAYHRLRRHAPLDAPRTYQARVKDAQGGRRPCLLTVDLIPGTTRSVASLMDLSELKQAQAQRKQLAAQLQQSQKMEALGTLAGGVAHDFNNILASILGFSEIALHDLLSPDHPAAPALSQVVLACRRARDLVAQILAFSRPSGEQRQPLQLASLLREGLILARASLPAHVQLVESLPQDQDPEQGCVLGDPTQIQQVLLNLVANAGQALNARGGRLEVGLEAKKLGASRRGPLGLPPGEYLVFRVADNGPGMPEEVRRRVFEPYFTTKPPGQGTGLGLAVAHGIVQAHQGAIQVQSKPGQGSCFLVWLPRAAQAAAEAEDQEPEPRGLGQRVLLVEDDQAVRQAVSALLGHLGYEVSPFPAADQALEAFALDPRSFDLAVSDQTMPGLNGWELMRRLRAISPALPGIICSGHGQPPPQADRELPGVLFLKKPVARRTLAQALAQVLAQWRDATP